MGGTPQAVEDPHKGVFSYEALRSRLAEGRFAKEGLKDLLAPIIRLTALSQEELYVLMEKLGKIHSDLYGSEMTVTHETLLLFLSKEFQRAGATTRLNVREVTRDFIEFLNIAEQNPDKPHGEILEDPEFSYAKPILDEEIDEPFAEFEV
jgi:hypothetical protein